MFPVDQEKREKLTDLLFELSKSQEILATPKDRAGYFRKLEEIYYNCDKDNFRHYYSDIFSTLSLINGDPTIGSLDILAQNIQTIKDGYTPKNNDENGQLIDISKEILKLYDHTNLDIARINYTTTMVGETKSELAKTKVLVEKLEAKIKDAEDHLKNVSDQNIEAVTEMAKDIKNSQKDMQKDYITILGIFAAIILAFTGQFAFSSSILENIGSSTAYRLVLIALIIGLVFFNLIWVLIDFIREICGKDISTQPKRKWNWFTVVNIILVLGIIMTCISYKFDWFKKIEPNDDTSITTTQTVSIEIQDTEHILPSSPDESEIDQ